MNVPLMPVIILLMLFLGGVYSAYRKRGQIFCKFEGKDKTIEFKWVGIRDDYVVFRGYKYDIVPERIQSIWLRSGINYLFPTRANYLEYTWYNRFPRDPDNYGLTVINPKVRKIINKSELVESYMKTSVPGATQKQTLLARYFPMIVIAALIILGFYFYTNMQGLASGLDALQNQINTIAR